MREHIASTEGPEGLHAELLAQAPRLANAVSRLVSEHEALTQGAGPARRTGQSMHSGGRTSRLSGHWGTDVVADISRHRQRGADLIYEAYEHDIGGED